MADITDPRIDALQPLVDRVRTDATARLVRNPDGSKRADWDKLPLTRELLAQHLNGGPPRGVALMRPDTNTTEVAVFDLDSHKGEVPWPTMLWAAGRICDALEIGWGMEPVVFRSGGGRGIHIYLLWGEAQDTYSVRMLCARALASVGLHAGVGALSTGAVEVYPKRDHVPAGKFGTQVFMPLYGAGELLEVCELAGMLGPVGADRVRAGMWRISPDVPAAERPVRTPGGAVAVGDAGGADLTRFRSALDWLADCINMTGKGGERNTWRDILYSIAEATGKSEEGLDLAHTFSAAIPDYDEDQVEVIWSGCELRAPGGVTAEHVPYRARELGWSDPARALTTDTFDVVVSDGSGGGGAGAGSGPGGGGAPLQPPPFTRTANGVHILPTATNAVLAVRRPDLTGWRVGHDEFKDEILIAEEGSPRDDGWRPMRDSDLVSLRMSLEALAFKAVPKELARDAVVKVCEENRFDSAIVWLERVAKGWDRKGRVDTFLIDYFGAVDDAAGYTRACGRYLWTAFAGRVLDPGCQVDMIVTLTGGQGLRKSGAIGAMVPGYEFAIEVDFSKNEEDTARRMRGALVGEIAELRGLHTKDLDAIKKFITRRHENWIPKYKEFSTTFPRRLVFVGSVNPSSVGFLGDETGERRWLPVPVERADVEGIAQVREQLWAEGAAMWRAGGVAWADAERLAAPMHEEFGMTDMWEGPVAAWLAGVDGMAEERGEGVSENRTESRGMAAQGVQLSEIASGALGIAVKDMGQLVQRRLGAIIRKLGYTRHRITIDGARVWRWVHESIVVLLGVPPEEK